jgi:hypothetical protein
VGTGAGTSTAPNRCWCGVRCVKFQSLVLGVVCGVKIFVFGVGCGAWCVEILGRVAAPIASQMYSDLDTKTSLLWNTHKQNGLCSFWRWGVRFFRLFLLQLAINFSSDDQRLIQRSHFYFK